MESEAIIPQTTLAKIDEDRIQKWEDKRTTTRAGISHCIDKIEGKEVHTSLKFPNEDQLTHEQKCDIAKATYSSATGSASTGYAKRMFDQTVNALVISKKEAAHEDANAIMGALLALNPQDEIEGMMCSRLLVLQDHYMEYMSRAKNSDDTQIIDANINRATKLMRLYNETLQALHKHRRKGDDQRVVVQHIHVNDGGQAVGIHAPGGGGYNKN